MSEIAVMAVGAVSALGTGAQAYTVAEPGQRAKTAITHDPDLAEAGLERPQTARAKLEPTRPSGSDRATELLLAALEQVCQQLTESMPEWRALRLGVCMGTSSGGMLSAEQFFTALSRQATISEAAARRATYFAPLDDALSAVDSGASSALPIVKQCQVVAACASSTVAIGLAMRWLERGACDLVLAGGYDGISRFVAAGFEKLQATSATSSRPFRSGRDGMALGEGAGVLALVAGTRAQQPLFWLSGFGASADGVHITAPDRTGAGLIRAGRAAMRDAACAPARVGLVSAHGTATPYNDAMEAKAIAALTSGAAPVVHAFKAQIGHTLGAAGVLETLAAAQALRHGLAPPTCGDGEIDPQASVRLLERATPSEIDTGLKLSAAFGGVTASLLIEKSRPPAAPARSSRAVRVLAHARVEKVDRAELAAVTGMVPNRLARIDVLGQRALAAVGALVAEVGGEAVEDAGVVAGYALATLDTNQRFFARFLEKGPRWLDPRLFPATSPNAGAGHCAIAFGLHGPNFAMNGGLCGPLEALLAAAELIAAGDADRMLVVAADDDGPAVRAWLAAAGEGRDYAPGSVAILLEAGEPAAGVRGVDLDMPVDHQQGPIGHLALLRWLATPESSR